MLEINALTFGYNDLLLKELSLHVREGEMVSIIGPSGSGKTTLFKLIAGFLSPKSGSITSKPLSYMMQEDLLLPWKTVMENLLFVFELNSSTNVNPENLRTQVLSILREVGLEGVEDQYPITLSGGMRQRVALARTLLFKRPLLLLDEPFGAVDVFRRKSLYELLKKVRKKHHLTILFITHDIHDATRLSDRIYYLDQGKLVERFKEELLEVLQW